MLSIPGMPGSTCDGFNRREFRRVGGSGLMGLALADVLRLREANATSGPATGEPRNGWNQAKNIIFIFLQGGPSHIDIWDPKPDAPAEVRGEFKPVATATPGIRLGEHMPHLCRQTGKLAIVRSIHHTCTAHGKGMYWNMTGHAPPAPLDTSAPRRSRA